MPGLTRFSKPFWRGVVRTIRDWSLPRIPEPPPVISRLQCERVRLQVGHRSTRAIDKKLKAATTERLKAAVAAKQTRQA